MHTVQQQANAGIAGDLVQHLPSKVEGHKALLAILLSCIPFQQPPPMYGNRVNRRTLLLHRDHTAQISYKFGGKKWKSQHIPEQAKTVLEELFELCDMWAGGVAPMNVVLLQLYGSEDTIGSLAWHADDEASMGRDPATEEVYPIVSVSLGCPARFRFRTKQMQVGKKRRRSEEITLSGGDVLIMKQGTQERHEHCVPSQGFESVRLSLTFRNQK